MKKLETIFKSLIILFLFKIIIIKALKVPLPSSAFRKKAVE